MSSGDGHINSAIAEGHSKSVHTLRSETDISCQLLAETLEIKKSRISMSVHFPYIFNRITTKKTLFC